MRRNLLPALFILALAALCGCLTFGQATDPATQLVARAMGQTPMLEDLQALTDEIGGRPTGSTECERAVNWSEAAFREAGVDVNLESFTIPNLWLPGSAEASCIAPGVFPLRIAAAPYSPSTRRGRPLEANLVDAGDGSAAAFAKLGGSAQGAIALVRSHEMKSLEDLFVEYLQNSSILEAAAKAKVSALLLQSTRPRGLLYRHPVTFNATFAPFPVAIIAREHASRLARLAETLNVRVRLSIVNKTGGQYQSNNVVAEIKGREQPDEIVVLGAHLDSWDLGTGANDNGVNSALVIDVARGIKQLGLNPRRTIRFVLFTGEEQGMWGSAGYVRRHADELDGHVAVVIFDIGSGRANGFFLNGRDELRRPIEEALRVIKGRKIWNNPLDGVDGTDNFDFLLAGVPNLVANQDPIPYLPDYHAESDVFEMVDQREAKTNAAIAAALVWGLANNPNPPARRQSRTEVERLLQETKLDEQMKAFGQWEDWANGRRGVNKP